MALSTTLEILQRAADELGLDRPLSVAASGNPQTRQLHAALNAIGHELMQYHAWGALQTIGTVTTVIGEPEYDLPDDYDRMIPDTQWDRSQGWRMVGPDSPQMDRWRRENGVSSVGIRRAFRQAGNKIRFFPTPTVAGDILVFEYVSKNWALSSSAVSQEETLADADTTVFDPHLLIRGVKNHFMAAKGMYADELRAKYEELRDVKVAGDLGGTTLNMSGDCDGQEFISLDSVPDGNWA